MALADERRKNINAMTMRLDALSNRINQAYQNYQANVE